MTSPGPTRSARPVPTPWPDGAGGAGAVGRGAAACAVDLFRAAAGQGRLDQPGRGRTESRFARLADISRASLGAGRLLEAHADAQTILLEAGWEEPEAFGLLGVWASEGRHAPLRLERSASGSTVHGTKAFCSGAPVLDHALVTVADGSERQLVMIDLRVPGVDVGPTVWVGPGMQSAQTRTVQLTAAPVVARVGEPGWYLRRPGFWHGAVGVAASWFGGARAVLDTMRAGTGSHDPHGLAHLGEAEAVVYALESTLERAARDIDRDPDDGPTARRRALAVRRTVAAGCIEVLEHAAAGLGPRAMALDDAHAQRIVDLDVYVRQEHGRRDSEQLGRLVAGREPRC